MTKPCKIWLGALDSSGYGLKSVDGKLQKVHRLSYKEAYGDFPVNNCLHTCDTPACYEPTHLYDGTSKQNAADRDNRGRTNKRQGETHGMSKVSEDTVREIRSLLAAGVSGNGVAELLGVSKHIVSKVKTGKAWAHVV